MVHLGFGAELLHVMLVDVLILGERSHVSLQERGTLAEPLVGRH